MQAHRVKKAVVPVSPETIRRAVAVLQAGGLVITRTATNYNLICDATQAEAVARVFHAKGRRPDAPLPVSLPEPSHIERYVRLPDWFDRRALTALLPGEVSFICAQRYPFPPALTAGLGTVAVSVTSDPVFRAIVRGVGGAVAATSANRSGRAQGHVGLKQAVAELGDAVDLILDAGPTAAVQNGDSLRCVNTIVDLTFRPPRLCRAGWVPVERIRCWLPDLDLDVDSYQAALAERLRHDRAIRTPGAAPE